MEYRIRKMNEREYPLLNHFLYEAIFQREGEEKFPFDIINKPELQIYIDGFGTQSDDFCLCAEAGGRIVGAAWLRKIRGYGYVDAETPELILSVDSEYRGRGIGTQLLKEMIRYSEKSGCRKLSLSVQKDNYAAGMYLKAGFRVVMEDEEEYIMVYVFEWGAGAYISENCM